MNYRAFWGIIATILNRSFWIASICVWTWLVVRSEIFLRDDPHDLFWINFWIFFAAGVGVVSTTNFAASTLPLLLGMMTLTTHDHKGAYVFLQLYCGVAIVIGFCALAIKVLIYLVDRNSTDRTVSQHLTTGVPEDRFAGWGRRGDKDHHGGLT